MKLISLYIENFGGLSRYSLDLTEGLTVIEEANGFGKTTLAEFIRAMFYGFPRKAKTLDKSRRQKYTPWNGGKFGGNLVFEAGGSQYRIERSFGATPKGDSFALIDPETARKSDRYSEEIGLELFRLDADSFERSTYLPQLSDGAALTTDSIRSKLSNLVEDTNDVGNFEKAVAALKAKRSTFVPYRGNGGSVMQAHSRVSQLQEQLTLAEGQRAGLEVCSETIEKLQSRQEQLEAEREQVRIRIRRVSEMAAAVAVHQHHDRLISQLNEEREKCSAFREKYPTGLPEQEKIDDARSAAAQLEILNSMVVTEPEDLEAALFVEKNRSRFETHTPTSEELAACRDRCGQLSALRQKTMELAASAAQQIAVKTNPLPLILFLLLGAAGGVLGPVLMLRGVYLWGGIAAGACLIGLAGAVFAAVRLAAARRQYRRLRQEQLRVRDEITRLSARTEELSARIRDFLEVYGPVEGRDFYGLLAELEHSSGDYLRAKGRVEQWQQEKAAYEEKLACWNSVVDAFFEEAGLNAAVDVKGQLLQIRDDRKDWEEAAQAVRELARELKEFEQENSHRLAEPVPEAVQSPEQLQQHESELTVELGRVSDELLRSRQQREAFQSRVQQIPAIRDELQQWQEKRAADQKRSDLLDDTLQLLEQAKENLSVSYLGPIRSSFAAYLEQLWGSREDRILVTPDLEVQLERYGAARELGYFSAGQTDSVMLCMRLALVDALFTQEKPFVILDDPFVNLDDACTAQALELLKTLAEDRQIIYLTCNSSRSPK